MRKTLRRRCLCAGPPGGAPCFGLIEATKGGEFVTVRFGAVTACPSSLRLDCSGAGDCLGGAFPLRPTQWAQKPGGCVADVTLRSSPAVAAFTSALDGPSPSHDSPCAAVCS